MQISNLDIVKQTKPDSKIKKILKKIDLGSYIKVICLEDYLRTIQDYRQFTGRVTYMNETYIMLQNEIGYKECFLLKDICLKKILIKFLDK